MDKLLTLLGELDDSPGEATARERFRLYLRENISDLHLLAAYIDGCLEAPDEQRSRALQDIVNHLGRFLGFDVTFGPYSELSGRIGYDGRWRSPLGPEVIVEVKADETFASRRATLVRSIEALIGRGEIEGWGQVAGLYVMGRDDLPTGFLERLILDEPQAHPLRIISISALHTLAELAVNQTLTHGQILELMVSRTPKLDPVIGIVSRVDLRATREFMAGLAPDPLAGSDENGSAVQDDSPSLSGHSLLSPGDGRISFG